MICIGVSKWLIYMTSVLAATRSFISVWIGILQSYEVTASQGAWDAHPIEGLPIFMLQWFLYVPIFGRWTIWRTPP
jgi:xanthine/uracil permease